MADKKFTRPVPNPTYIIPPAAKEESDYRAVYEGQLQNTMTTVNSKKTRHTEIEKDGKQQWLFDLEDIGGGVVTLKDPEKNSLSLSSSQLLDYIAIHLTDNLPYGAPEEVLAKKLDIIFSVDDYMKRRGIASKDDAVKQLKKDLQSLFNASTVGTCQYHVGSGKSRRLIKETLEIHYLDAIPKGRIEDVVHITVALSYAKYLTHSQVMTYPLRILLANKNQNVYYIGKKLALHANMNYNKSNKDCISIESVLKYTPNIPSFEEEEERGRHYKTRIIEPLENTLDELVDLGVLSEWTFWHKNKTPFTDEELMNYRYTKESGKEVIIHFKFKNMKPRNVITE